MGDEDPTGMKELILSVNLLRQEVADNTRKTEQILKGFADSDPEGHRRYHEEVMQAMADRRKLRQEILTHLLKTSAWAALAGICFVLWKYLKSQP